MLAKRFVVAVATVWLASFGTLHASDNSTKPVSLAEIRGFVKSVSNEQLSAFVADQQLVVETAVYVVKKTRTTDQKVLDEIVARFATLPEFANRKVTFLTFRPKNEQFAPEAISLGDVIYVNQDFIGKILFVPGGHDVLIAMIAHESSHGRDFLVKRAIANDKNLSVAEKQKMLLQIEIDADRGAVTLLRGIGMNPDAMKTMLVGFGETERLHEVESSLVTLSAGQQ